MWCEVKLLIPLIVLLYWLVLKPQFFKLDKKFSLDRVLDADAFNKYLNGGGGERGHKAALKEIFGDEYIKNLDILSDGTIIAESGVMLGNMVKKATKQGIKGLESLIGVPGTLGGAIIMNAVAYGMEISNYLVSIKVMKIDGKAIDEYRDS